MAAGSIGEAISPGSAQQDSADHLASKPAPTPLDALPTASLVVRVWCGLTSWVLAKRRAFAQSAPLPCTAAPALVTDADPRAADMGATGSREDGGGDGGGGGKINGPDVARGESLLSLKDNRIDGDVGQLDALLGWILLDKPPDRGGLHTPGDGNGTVSAGPACSNGGKRGVTVTSTMPTPSPNERKECVAAWRTALFCALVRELSRTSACAIVHQGGVEDITRKREPGDTKWLVETPVCLLPPCRQPQQRDSSRLQATTAGSVDTQKSPNFDAVRDCPKCASMKAVRDVLVRGWDAGMKGRDCGSRDGNSSERGSTETPTVPLVLPLWLWLLARGLGGRCSYGCGTPSSASEGDRQHEAKGGGEGDDDGPRNKRRIYQESGHRADNGRALIQHNSTMLPEILEFLPRGALARIFSVLSRGSSSRQLVNGVGGKHGNPMLGRASCQDFSEQPRHTPAGETKDACLRALARTWSADVRRKLSAWGPFGHSPSGNDPNDPLVEVNLALGVARERSPARKWPEGTSSAEEQPCARLLTETMDALRVPLKLAIMLSRSPLLTDDPARNLAEKIVEQTDVGIGVSQTIVQAEAGVAEPRLSLEMTQGVRLWAHPEVVSAVFGPAAASLWQQLFAARRGYSPGFGRELRRLAKDCATLAFSASAVDLSVSRQNKGVKGIAVDELVECAEIDRHMGGWGLAFSQSQPTQTDEQNGNRRERNENLGEEGPEQSNASQQTVLEPPAEPRGSTQDSLVELGLELGQAPPAASLPLLTTVTLALLRASLKETGLTRMRAWGGGLASLAWILASPLCLRNGSPMPASLPTTPKRSARGGKHAAVTPAPNELVAKLGDCLEAVRWAVASDVAGRRSGGGWFPLDKDALAPLCRFLAAGISRWGTVRLSLSRRESNARRRSGEPAVCLFSSPDLREKGRTLSMSVLSGMKALPKEAAASPELLRALSPLLVAILDMPISKCV